MLELEARWKVSEQAIHLRYSATNVSASAVYCLNHLFHESRSGRRTIDSTMAFVDLVEDRLVCQLLSPPMPDDLDAYPIIPYAELLQPGSRTTGEILISLPVRINQPYRYAEAQGLPQRTRSAVLQMGYLVASDEIVTKSRDYQGRLIFSLPPQALVHQLVVSTRPVALAVPVA